MNFLNFSNTKVSHPFIYCSSFVFLVFRKKLLFPWKIQLPTFLITLGVIGFANYLSSTPWHSLIAVTLILLHYYCQLITLNKTQASQDSYLFIKVMAGTAYFVLSSLI